MTSNKKHPTYQLTKVTDLLLIPEDRMLVAIEELKVIMPMIRAATMAHLEIEGTSITPKNMAEKAGEMMDSLDWTDDGSTTHTMNIGDVGDVITVSHRNTAVPDSKSNPVPDSDPNSDKQKLVDIVFSCVSTALYSYDSKFKDMTQDQRMEWVANQLRAMGFPTTQRDMSWGILSPKAN